MKRSLLRIVAALGAVVALGSGVLALSTLGASAASVLKFTGLGQHATVTGSYLDAAGVSHDETAAAGEMLANIDGVASQGYCIDLSHGISVGATLPETDWQQMPVSPARIDSIAWILNHYYPQIDPAFPLQGTNAQKAAAVQSAIWHFSDGFDLGPKNDATITANYKAILNAVPLTPNLGEPITSLKLQTPDGKHLAGDIVPVTVRTTGVGKIVNVVVTSGDRVDAAGAAATGAVGDGDTVYVRRNDAGAADVAVNARAQVQKGRIFRVAGTQAQILARSVTVDANAKISVSYDGSAQIRLVKKSFGTKKDAQFQFTLSAPGAQAAVTKTLTYEGTLEWKDNIRPGVTYELRELATTGWWIAPQSCTGGDTQVLATNDGFRVTPRKNETITCEIHNIQPPKIYIEKRLVDGATSNESFNFSLDDGQTLTLKAGESKWFATPPGAKKITEHQTSGWVLVDASCTNAATGDVVRAVGADVSLTLQPGDRWNCIYVNGPPGTPTTTTIVGASTTVHSPTTTTPAPTTTVAASSTTVPETTTTMTSATTTIAVCATTTTTAGATTSAAVATSAATTTTSACSQPEVLGVRESRGKLTVMDSAAVPGRLARTGSNRTKSYAGIGFGTLVTGIALFFLGRSTTVTPSFVYVGGRKVRRRRK